MNKTAIKKYVDVIRRACDLIEESLGESNELESMLIAAQQEANSVVSPKKVSLPPKEETSPQDNQRLLRQKHIQDLMAIDCWPEALPGFKMAVTDDQHINKANAILDSMAGRSLEGLHFLDFGCGDGWLARQAAKRGTETTTGFDIVSGERWGDMPDVQFVTNVSELEPSKYDIVFLYDVLDHTHDPEQIMAQVRNLLSPTGTVYVRCHPWTSKHASHLPKQGLNKSYIHLFLTWDELKELGYEPMFTRPEKNPIEAYRWWFRDFSVRLERNYMPEPLHEFFKVPAFKELVIQEQGIGKDRADGFFKDMELNFVDFTLVHKKV